MMVRYVCLFVLIGAAYGALPSTISRCPIDANLDDCIARIIEKTRPYWTSGNFGEGFITSPIDPVTVPEVNHSADGLFNITILDGTSRGGANTKITRVKSNIDNLTFLIDSVAPELTFNGRFVFKVNWGEINSEGGGTMHVIFKNFRVNRKISFKRETVNGVEYIRFKRYQQKIKVDDAHFHVENLTGPAVTLRAVADDLLNANKEWMIQTIVPQLESRSAIIYDDILRVLFKSVTFQDMFIV